MVCNLLTNTVRGVDLQYRNIHGLHNVNLLAGRKVTRVSVSTAKGFANLKAVAKEGWIAFVATFGRGVKR